MASVHDLILRSTGEVQDLTHGSVFFIGTATVILRYGDLTILTDPNFLHAGDHVHLGYGLTAKRLTDPAIDIEALPPIDVCILSHYHGDHFDRVAEARLRKDLPIVTTPHAARKLERKGFRAAQGLRTWEAVRVTKGRASMRIVSMPGRHAPGLLSRLLPPVMGSMLLLGEADQPPRFSIYITGDTLLFEGVEEIAARHRDIDLELLHLGGTMILGMLMVTMDAEQGVAALRVTNPRKVIPIHYDDYSVFKSPLSDFTRAANANGLHDQIIYLQRGDTYEFEISDADQKVAEPPVAPRSMAS